MGDHRQVFYDNYEAFKEQVWSAGLDDYLAESYAIEMKRASAIPGHTVLELGFGSGRFLDWCKEHEFSAFGMEAAQPLVEKAKERGHTVWLGTNPSQVIPGSMKFDLIVAIDVFEHLTVEELLQLFEFCKDALNPSGKILARFPNGASPFSLPLQNGDVTHASSLTPQKIAQIAKIHSFVLEGAYNAARPLRGGKRPPWVRKFGYLARDVVTSFLCMTFHGKKFPMDANVTVVLGKNSGGHHP